MIAIPTVFAQNKKEFQIRFDKILPIAKNIQIDFMDGKFVPTKSIALKEIPNLKKYKKNFEAHLMCLHPEEYILALKRKGFKKVLFHYESTKHPGSIIKKIETLKLRSGVVFNPSTSFSEVLKLKDKVEVVMFMGHVPGKEHVKFDNSVFKKIRQLRNLDKKIKIQVDGGVNEQVARTLAKLKINAVNLGSFVADSENPKEALKKINNVFR